MLAREPIVLLPLVAPPPPPLVEPEPPLFAPVAEPVFAMLPLLVLFELPVIPPVAPACRSRQFAEPEDIPELEPVAGDAAGDCADATATDPASAAAVNQASFVVLIIVSLHS